MLYYGLFFIIGSEFEFLDTQNLIFKLFISKNTSKIIRNINKDIFNSKTPSNQFKNNK